MFIFFEKISLFMYFMPIVKRRQGSLLKYIPSTCYLAFLASRKVNQ